MIRPMADGALVALGDGRTLVVSEMYERIVSVCTKATIRTELAAILTESSEFEPANVDRVIDLLVETGILEESDGLS